MCARLRSAISGVVEIAGGVANDIFAKKPAKMHNSCG